MHRHLAAACPELILPARNEGLKSLLFPAWSPGGLVVPGRSQAAPQPPAIQNKPIKVNWQEFKLQGKAIINLNCGNSQQVFGKPEEALYWNVSTCLHLRAQHIEPLVPEVWVLQKASRPVFTPLCLSGLSCRANLWTMGFLGEVVHVPADNGWQRDVFQHSLLSGSAWKIDLKMCFRMCQIFSC